jgi:hypothetical protein
MTTFYPNPSNVTAPGSKNAAPNTIVCRHKRGCCKCLDKALALARQTNAPVHINLRQGGLTVEPNIAKHDR